MSNERLVWVVIIFSKMFCYAQDCSNLLILYPFLKWHQFYFKWRTIFIITFVYLPFKKSIFHLNTQLISRAMHLMHQWTVRLCKYQSHITKLRIRIILNLLAAPQFTYNPKFIADYRSTLHRTRKLFSFVMTKRRTAQLRRKPSNGTCSRAQQSFTIFIYPETL